MGRVILTELNHVSSLTAERVTWTLAQGQVDSLRLKDAAYQARDGEALEELRIKFDLYYSRIYTFNNGRLLAELRAGDKFADLLARVQTRLDHMVSMIDGSDQGLRDAIPELIRVVQENQRDMRALALLGLNAESNAGAAKRQHLSLTLERLGWVLIALVVILGLTALMIIRLYHRGRVLTAASNATAARMRAMVTSSLDAILVVDAMGCILSLNGAAESAFGYSQEEAIGKKMVDLIVPGHLHSVHFDAMKGFLETGDAKQMKQGRVRLDAKRKSGETFPVELSITLSHSGQDTVFVSYLRDISDRIAAETELTNARDDALAGERALTRARDDALAGERAKENLLTVMSHEMRTPLNGVLGSMELLETTGMTPEQNSICMPCGYRENCYCTMSTKCLNCHNWRQGRPRNSRTALIWKS